MQLNTTPTPTPNTDSHAVRIDLAGSTMFTSNEVSFSDVISVDLPDKTDSYMPLSNAAQINMVKSAFETRGFDLVSERYGLSCKGRRMVSLMAWHHPDLLDEEMALFSASLNSYDKSTAAKSALGGKLFVCENLQISGEITCVRRHTLNVIEDYERLIEDAADRAIPMFLDLSKDMELLKTIEIDQRGGYQLLGQAHGLWGERGGFLSPTQVNGAVRAWKKPLHEAFEDRNLFSWYQCANEALKTSPAHDILQRHSALHRFAMKIAKSVDSTLLIEEN